MKCNFYIVNFLFIETVYKSIISHSCAVGLNISKPVIMCSLVKVYSFLAVKSITYYPADMFHLLFPLSDKLNTFLQAAEILQILDNSRKVKGVKYL